MGYRVEYGPVRKRPKKSRGSFLRIQLWTVLFLMIFVLTVNLTWPEGRSILWDFLLPGDSAVSQSAFSELLADLKEGEPLADAVTVFCRSILEDAHLAE